MSGGSWPCTYRISCRSWSTISTVPPSGWLRTMISTDGDGVVLGHADDQVFNVGDAVQAAVHQGEVERVLLLVEPARGHEIRLRERVGDLRQREVLRGEAERVRDDVELGLAPADQVHPRDAGDPQEPRLDDVLGRHRQFRERA